MCGRHAAVQFEPPEAARPPGQRTGGFCQLVSVVRCAAGKLRCLPWLSRRKKTCGALAGRRLRRRFRRSPHTNATSTYETVYSLTLSRLS